jgi:hypothetical protein
MLFFHRDESLREPALRDFIDEMKLQMFYKLYVDERELVDHVNHALLNKAMHSQAEPHIKALRKALFLRVNEWAGLEPQSHLLEQAYALLCLAAEDLKIFAGRQAGLNIGSIDAPVDAILRNLDRLTRDKDQFMDCAPWAEAENAMRLAGDLLKNLPEEHELL